MKRFVSVIYSLVCASILYAQNAAHVNIEQQTEIKRRAHYKEVVTQIFKDDELFVLFYLNLALVVDPAKDTQVVEPIKTENPWESLTEYIRGKSNIYFCPSGSQLSVAIEYMPCPIDPDILMSDRYGMYRLSSPVELFKNRGESFKNTKHKAVVFGGLKYDEESKSIGDNLLAFRGNRENIEGYKYLKSTYDEAVYIDSIFRRNGIETALLTGEDGTERSFAQIPNHQVDILHIASHGFYEPDDDNTGSSSLQEWMMSHAGLVLAGAENDTDDRANDGKLTAYEISQTDLSGVNLAVLSACDTGLGDIKENDVFGLIKGFKKAGAGTLLVTLSEVNDTVTSLLMKRFYDNIFRGDNPRRALENTQRYIRLHGNGQFNKPEYWASFVLVDDLDRNIGLNVSEQIKQSFLSDIVREDDIYFEDDYFPNWNEIRKKLKKEDVVIRVMPYSNSKGIEYVAMLGDVGNGKCYIKQLFYADVIEREKICLDSLCNIDVLLWEQIMPKIKNKKRVFIHLSGILYNYPIEHTKFAKEKEVYRISSMSSLMGSHKKDKIRNYNIALFGGLYYDTEKEEEPEIKSGSLLRDASDIIPYLPGTKTETDSIAHLFDKNKVLLYQDYSGTKNAFESLSGKNIQIIHIATHAYGRSVLDSFAELGSWFNHSEFSINNYLLGFSGLLFSGVQDTTLDNFEHPINQKGILTGADISILNLEEVRLLTLSACETGKNFNGNTHSDITWNMVSAFKKAGVKAILASLWKVDDKCTCLLMTNFYKNLLAGNGMVMSLRKAQERVRNYTNENGHKLYNAPKYWASFVLIDAIE